MASKKRRVSLGVNESLEVTVASNGTITGDDDSDELGVMNGHVSGKRCGCPLQVITCGITISYFNRKSCDRHLEHLRKLGNLELVDAVELWRCVEPQCKVSMELTLRYSSHGACGSDIIRLTEPPRTRGHGYRIMHRDLHVVETRR